MIVVSKVAEFELAQFPEGVQFDIGTRKVGDKLELLLRFDPDQNKNKNKQKAEQ